MIALDLKKKRGFIPLKPLKWYRSLASKKGRIAAEAFIVEGEKAVEHILKNHPDRVCEIVMTNKCSSLYDHFFPRIVTEAQFRSISQMKSPQGILAIVQLPLEMYSHQLPGQTGTKILLLEDIQDPGNIGTLIRTAAAFNFSGIIMTENCADPLSPKCIQASAGSIFSIWIRRTFRYIEIIKDLREQEYVIIAADLGGCDHLSEIYNNKRIMLALGNEASGLSDRILKLSDFQVKLPISREKSESLNVAVCGGIFMYLSSVTCKNSFY